jgi:hypothetical protein
MPTVTVQSSSKGAGGATAAAAAAAAVQGLAVGVSRHRLSAALKRPQGVSRRAWPELCSSFQSPSIRDITRVLPDDA